MKKLFKLLLILVFIVYSMPSWAQIKLGDLNVKGSITGTEKIPVSGSGNPAITPNLLSTFLLTAQAGNNGKYLTTNGTSVSWATVSGSGISGLTTNSVPYATSSSTIGSDPDLNWDPTNNRLYVGAKSGETGIRIHQGGTATQNTFVGKDCGNSTVTGDFNSFFGAENGLDVSSGSRNTGMGYAAPDVLNTGSDNTLYGYRAGATITAQSRNTIIGSDPAQGSGGTGDDNTWIGYNSAFNATSESNCIAIGKGSFWSNNGLNNQMSIGNLIYGQGINGTGNTASTGQIGIGVRVPLTKLHVDGEIRLGTTGTAGNQTISVASSTTDANLILTPQGAGIVSTTRLVATTTATLAGLNPGSLAGNPSSLTNGDFWYNSSTSRQMARINGASRALNDATDLIGTVPTTSGGTGLTTIGTAGQVIQVNAGGTALEYGTPAGGSSWATTGNTNVTTPTITGIPTFIGNTVTQTNALAATSVGTSEGLVVENSTAALVGAQVQRSPVARFRSHAWITGSGGVDRSLDWAIGTVPTAGTSTPSQVLNFYTQINGGGYTNLYAFNDQGTIFVGAVNGGVNIAGAGATLTNQIWSASNNNTKLKINLPTGAITTGIQITATSIAPLTYDAIAFEPGTYAPATSTGTYRAFVNSAILNTTGSYTGTHIGFDHNPTLTSVTGLTNLAFRGTSGSLLLGGTTLTASTRTDIKGLGTTTGITLRLADSGDNAKFSFVDNGDFQVSKTITAGGTTGAQTINKIAGTVNFAAAATTLVVTNSLVTTSSIILPVTRTNDATATVKNIVPASGSFTITLSAAATAETSVGFFIVN